jgi:hypothetical protein
VYPNDELAFWVEASVKAEPGIWTARLCRSLNDLPECRQSVVHCGLCTDYANARKRHRARKYDRPTLPGLQAPYQLHAPCACLPFKKLQYLLCRVRDWDLVHSLQERIPDERNWRGWDFASRWYPT